MKQLVKSYSLFGRELYRVERDVAGNFFYNYSQNSFGKETNNYLKLSFENPVLMTICALRSKVFSQMKISHIGKDGKEIQNSSLVNLFKTPNPFQSQEDFFYQMMWFLSCSGENFTYEIKSTSYGDVQALYNLVPSEIDFNKINKINYFIFSSKEKKDFAKNQIKYTLDNKTYSISWGDIVPVYDLSNGLKSSSLIHGESRVKSILKPLQNIEENLKAKNINLQLSQKYLVYSDANDGFNPTIKEDDRHNIEKTLSNSNVMISDSKVNGHHLVSDMKNLMLDEQFNNDAMKCLLAFEMNKDILNFFGNSNSKYENAEKGELRFLQNSIQGIADSVMNSFSQQRGLFEKGEKLVASYDHLPIMQVVLNEKIKTFADLQNALKVSVESGFIDVQEAKLMIKELRNKIRL